MSTPGLSECERQFKEGRWDPQLCEESWSHISPSSDAHSVRLVYDIQHCLNGLTSDHLDLLDAWQEKQRHVSWPLYWRLLSAELQTGMMQQAALRIQCIENQRYSVRRNFALHRFPMALDYLEQRTDYPHDYLSSQMTHLASRLLQRTTTLPLWCEEKLRQKNTDSLSARIAIVGNGPSIIGSSAGQSIDKSDLVIRFNQIHTEDSFSHDTGRQTDLWVVSPGFRIRQNRLHCSELCLSGAAPFMRSSRYWSRLARLPSCSVALTPLANWHSLVRQLEAPPSAGVLVLDTLIRHFPSLHIDIHGFTTNASESKDTQRAGRHYGDFHTVSTRHDWQKETMLIRKWISMGKLHQG